MKFTEVVEMTGLIRYCENRLYAPVAVPASCWALTPTSLSARSGLNKKACGFAGGVRFPISSLPGALARLRGLTRRPRCRGLQSGQWQLVLGAGTTKDGKV